MRPRFEDDTDVVEAFTMYDELIQQRQRLEREKGLLTI